MSNVITRNAVLLVKVEATNGTDVVPAVADAIELEGQPELGSDFEIIERELANGGYVNGLPVVVAKKRTLGIRLRLRGSGTAVTAPKWMRLLQAAGFKVAADVDHVDATPDPAEKDTVTAYLYMGGNLHKLVGCAFQDASISFDGGWILSGTLIGKWVAVGSQAAPGGCTFDSGDIVSGLAPTFTYKARSAILRGLSLDLGVTVSEKVNLNDATGYDHFIATGHVPGGSMTIEDEPEGTFDWRDLGDADQPAATEAMSMAFGTGAGNQVTPTLPNCRLAGYTDGNENGIATLEFPLHATDSAAGAKDWINIRTE